MRTKVLGLILGPIVRGNHRMSEERQQHNKQSKPRSCRQSSSACSKAFSCACCQQGGRPSVECPDACKPPIDSEKPARF